MPCSKDVESNDIYLPIHLVQMASVLNIPLQPSFAFKSPGVVYKSLFCRHLEMLGKRTDVIQVTWNPLDETIFRTNPEQIAGN